MELTGTEMIFSWHELRDAIEDGSIDRMVKNIEIMLNDGFTVSVHTRFRQDLPFKDIEELKAYIATINTSKKPAASPTGNPFLKDDDNAVEWVRKP
ncbi:MAG: hypothetical protein ACKN9T_17800 [Candidatus Methylumidiphilus sp.]